MCICHFRAAGVFFNLRYSTPDAMAPDWDPNSLASDLWTFLERHGFAVLAVMLLVLLVKPRVDAWREQRHANAVMARATGAWTYWHFHVTPFPSR